MADEALVDLAISKGIITEAQLAAARVRQDELADRGLERSLWLLLQDDGSVDSEVARDLERRTSSDSLDALVVDGYVIQGRIGKGGMGEVFYGVRQDGSEAAIKILPTSLARDQEYLGRFQREVEALSRLQHPHITAFHGRGTTGGRPYLVMELIRGQSLKERLQTQGAINELEARVLLRQMSEALQSSWEGAGLVHRDIKPANILLGESEDPDLPFVAKLCDFGLAKFQGRSAYTVSISHGGLTHSGVAIGTPHYMSPEQATGDRSVDQRHDIYGLGATVYHALLGKTLYTGGSSAVIMYKQATAALDMAPLSKHGVTPELTRLLKSMLAKPAEKRIADWASVRKELAALPSDRDLVDGRAPAAKPKPIDVKQSTPAAAEDGRATAAAGARRPGGILPLVFISVALVRVLAGGLLSQLGAPVERRLPVTVATWSAVLGEARQALAERPGQVVLELAPGTYPRLELGSADSGLRLHGGPGVVVEHVDAAAVIAADADDIELRGVALRSPAGTALISAGEDVRLIDCSIGPCLRAIECRDGHLEYIDGSITEAGIGIQVDEGGEFVLRNSLVVSGGALLRARNASVSISGSRLHAEGPEADAACRLQGGVATFRSVHIGGSGPWIGLALDQVGLGQLSDVRIVGGATALAARETALDPVEGLQLQAGETGLRWRGSWSDDWRWSRILIDAPVQLDGLEASRLGDALQQGGDLFLRLADIPALPETAAGGEQPR